ncbi:MAG: PAS domain S-box protein [Fuerstia sp.]|nr:PAS domain S-box protein [Fuerstiella sp.]
MNESASPRTEALRKAVLVMLLLTPVWLFVTWSQAESSQQDQQEQVRQILRLQADSLNHRMQRLEEELQAMQEFTLQHDTESPESFAESFANIANGMRADSTWVRAYQIVDDGVITHCFPPKGNEAAMGFNLYKHPNSQVIEDLRIVMQTGDVRLTGPVPLIQGGAGLILRDSEATPMHPLRSVAIVIKLDPFLAEAGIRRIHNLLQIAVRRVAESPFVGSPEVFESNPEIIEFQRLNQVWQIAGVPTAGWNEAYFRSVLVFGGNGAAILGLAGILTYIIAVRQQHLTQSLSHRTTELSVAHAQLEQDVQLLSSAQAQLRLSETRFRAVFEQAAIGVAIIDSETMRFVQANTYAAGILGYRVSDLNALTLSQIIYAEDRDSYTESLEMLLTGDIQEYSIEYRCIRADGRPIWVHQMVSAINSEIYEAPLLIALFEDIQHRKSIEQRLQVLADSLPGLLLYIDRSLVIQFVNKMGETWHAKGFGPATDDMLGHHLETVLSPDQFKFAAPWIQRALNGETVEFVFTEGDLDSEPRFRNVTYAPHLAEDGSVPGFFALVMDITDRRRAELKRDELERHLMQAQKMEAVGTLAGGIAHDFNNMLQVILGYSDILLMQIEDQPLIAEQISAIRSAARRSSELTHQLLAFARRQSTAPMALDLNEAVPRMLRLMRRVVSEEIELTWSPIPELWPIFIDPAQWDQIMANLIVNSRDAIDGRGKITITARNLPATGTPESLVTRCSSGDCVIFSISDNGCGIDEATQARIFEPFFTTKEFGKGTGLGLSIVYGIVHAHGGVISVSSKKGSGTTFEICFPRSKVQFEKSSPGTPVQQELTGSETILLVEDEPLVLDLGKSLLKKLGYNVIVARSAAEAIMIAEQNVVHLLITDVIMPDMHGRDLADAIVNRQNHTRVLFMSGFANDVVQRKGAHELDIDFLQKPFSPGELANRIREILAN